MKFEQRLSTGWPRRIADAVPADLAATAVLAMLADVAVLVDVAAPVRAVAVLPLLFFLPGYVVVASLYPGESRETRRPGRGIGLFERMALSFGMSVALLPMVVMAIWTVWASSPSMIVFGLFAVVMVGVVVGTVRRLHLPPERQFALPFRRWQRAIGQAFGGSTSLVGRLLNVFLAVSVVLAVGALGFALVAPPTGGETYTGVSLLSENADGELVAAGEPTFSAGEPSELFLEVTNKEGETTSYSVVVQLERVDSTGDDFEVVEREELDRFTVEVSPEETRRIDHQVAPSMTGEHLRLSYYVYRGDAPARPDDSSAYRYVYAWTVVQQSD